MADDEKQPDDEQADELPGYDEPSDALLSPEAQAQLAKLEAKP